MKKSTFEDCFSKEAMLLSWERVLSSVGDDARDFFGISVFKENLDESLDKVIESITSSLYNPKRPFKYFEPKSTGTQRTKTVLGIEDALVYQAIANHIAELYYPLLLETNQSVFGSILNKDVSKGIKLLSEDPDDYYFFESYVEPYNKFIGSINETVLSGNVTHILETDITGFFDTIPHSIIIIELQKKGIHEQILELLSKCLNIWSGTRDSLTIGVGIPQGPAASFLIANIILDSMDRLAIKSALHYFRFMDDIRVYGKSRKELIHCLSVIDRHLKAKSLCLNTHKTSVEEINRNNSVEEKILDDYGIVIEKELKNEHNTELDKDIIEQDSTQPQIEEVDELLKVLDFIPIYETELNKIESNLIEFYKKNKKKNSWEFNNFQMRELLTLGQKWRTIVKVLILENDFKLNEKMNTYMGVWNWNFLLEIKQLCLEFKALPLP